MPNGIIDLDTPFAKEIGFTSDRFLGYLWGEQDRIVISVILSLKPGEGNFSRLMSAIEAKGLKILVPTPFPRMRAILIKKGYKMRIEDHPELGNVELWEQTNE